jgi:hypothetical protein
LLGGFLCWRGVWNLDFCVFWCDVPFETLVVEINVCITV